jgi:pimeloyl-ACP methyl ester carboxylesterase
MRGRVWAGCVCAAVLVAVAGTHAVAQDAARAPGMPGMTTHRMAEPVFNGQVVVYEAGRGNKRAIMLVHGIGEQGAQDYRGHIGWLRESFHVIAMDLPGFGQSDRSNALYSPANYARVLKLIADRFLDRPFVLVGHSVGALASLRYAADYPNDIERLVVISAPGVLHRHTVSSRYLAQAGQSFIPGTADSLDGLIRLAGKILTPLERLGIDPQDVLSTPEERERALAADPVRIAGLAAVIDDLHQKLPRIRAETLVIWGGRDEIAPLRNGRVLAAKISRARLEVIEDAEHTPMDEAPLRFQAVLGAFLEYGLASVTANVAALMAKNGVKSCRRERGRVFEGEYDKLTLESCVQARIRNARVRELRILGSTVTIDDSHIGGGKIGMSVRNSTVVLTGGRIEGGVAISVYGSRLDLAAVEVVGREAAVKSLRRSYVVFSLSRLNSPHTQGEVHEFYTVTETSPR